MKIMRKEKLKKRPFLPATAVILLVVLCCSTVVAIVAAAMNHVPVERASGGHASVIAPVVSGAGSSAEVVTPTVLVDGEEGQKPFEPFVPDLKDDEPFVDMESAYDFSRQYDYSGVVLANRFGTCDVFDGEYTATSAQSIYANTDASTPFPYGTLSADVMNNGSDCGLVFGLSSASVYF